MQPLFQKIDAVVLRVPSLDEGISYYSDRLGHRLLWRSDTMVALAMSQSDTELVLTTNLNPETDVLVASVDQAVAQVIQAGGMIIMGPEDIDVGRLAVVQDPFGNQLTLVDLTKGQYATDANGNVTGVAG